MKRWFSRQKLRVFVKFYAVHLSYSRLVNVGSAYGWDGSAMEQSFYYPVGWDFQVPLPWNSGLILLVSGSLLPPNAASPP